MIDGNHLLFSQEGVIQAGATRVLTTTPKYDHCNFTVLDGAPRELIDRFRDLLLGMSYADSAGSPLLRYGGFAAKKGADARLLAGMSAFGLHREFARVGTLRGPLDTRITCGNVCQWKCRARPAKNRRSPRRWILLPAGCTARAPASAIIWLRSNMSAICRYSTTSSATVSNCAGARESIGGG
jgi:hypothetical protein